MADLNLHQFSFDLQPRPPAVEWRKIPDFPDYSVSSDGQVRRDVAGGTYRAGRLLNGSTVTLCRGGEKKKYYVPTLQRLVFSPELSADIPGEEWRSIPGWPEYAVSSYGRVRRMVSTRGSRAGKLVKSHLEYDGYPRIMLYRGCVGTGYCVHQLVCLAFHGPKPTDDHEVAHWDGDRDNCRVDNLRWATHEENEADRVRHGRVPRGEQLRSKLTDVAVRAIRQRVAAGERQARLAEEFEVNSSTISEVISRKRWKHI
jgi:hypothetical protein